MKELQRRRAELTVDDRGHEISSHIGSYSNEVTVALAKKHEGKVLPVRHITRVQYGRVSERNERYVRQRISLAVNMLLRSGIPAYPIYNPEGRHEVMGIKVLTEYTKEDDERLTAYQDAAIARGDLSQAKAEWIKKAMEALKKMGSQ
jgi:hypothetical protein